jgi:hypothetical protein
MGVAHDWRSIFAYRKNALKFELAVVELSLIANSHADELQDWFECYKDWRDNLEAYVEAIPDV